VSGIRHPELISSLESTKYPFIPTATLTNGKDSLLEGTFLDAHIYAVDGTGRYYISQVVVDSSKFTVTIGDSVKADRLTGVISLPITKSAVRLVDEYGRPGGLLVSEPTRLAVMAAWGLGVHKFELSHTEFCVTCQMPVPEHGISGFRLPNGEIVTGKVWFMGQDGVVLSVAETTDKYGQVVEMLRVDVIGDPLYLQKLCDPNALFEPVNPIRTIRVVSSGFVYECSPGEQGNFNIQMNDALASDAALRVHTTPKGIIITVEGSTA
jgi:hypothetical protein